MSRKVLPAVFVLTIMAAACATPTPPSVTFGSGKQFVPEVADFLDDVGLGASVAVDAQGTPYISYFGFLPELKEGEIAPTRPIGAPSLPAVLMASTKDGIWTRGAVATQAPIPNVSVPFGPATVRQVKSMTSQNVNGTALAIDPSGGFHVAWAADTGLWYAESTGTSFTATLLQAMSPSLERAGPLGPPAVAVTPSGTPWVAFMLTTARGQELTVKTMVAGAWKTDVLETIPRRSGPSQPYRVAATISASGQPVVVYSNGSSVYAAELGGGEEGGWAFSTVESGADGYGLSATAGKDGIIHVSYYAGDQVHAATSKDGISWQATTVADVGKGANEAGRSTGIASDDAGTVSVTWYDPGTDSVQLASATGDSFEPIEVKGTNGGALPALAATPDGSAVYVAWYSETTQDLMLGTSAEVSGLDLAVPSPTPSAVPTTTTPASQCTKASNGVVDIVAQGIAYDTNCLEAPASTPFTIAFDNKDTGIQHNVSVYPSATDLTKPIEQGEIITGPATADYKVPALKPGDYYFHCDVHPTQMNGTLRVAGGGGGGGGGSGGGGGGGSTGGGGGGTTTEVTAQGLAFDTDTITLAAGTKSTITFTNDDAGIQHDIAIFPNSTDLSSPLFRGDLVTGPDKVTYTIPALKSGTYYFHCDVHPTMSGQVVVK
ncbi:MAG TPA: cupredoxin domain-containing protein [Actinomycetota bacterium]|nr:cupredoxin domain-containing protein [Actinomycetota bacterium]